jgi:hypothetical protein
MWFLFGLIVFYLPAKYASFVLSSIIFFFEITPCNVQEFFSNSFLPPCHFFWGGKNELEKKSWTLQEIISKKKITGGKIKLDYFAERKSLLTLNNKSHA